MPDDTSTVLSRVLGCATWDVVAEVERIAPLVAEAERLAKLVDEISEQGWRHPYLKRARLRAANKIAPNPGRFRVAVLAAQKRGIPWKILDEAAYLALVGKPCAYCGGSTGGGIGLDRLDSRGCYEVANVVPSCGPCNVAQGRGRRLPPAPRNAP